MSASDKKKLRKEQVAAAKTEKQRKQKAEEKKLKIYTIVFVVALALIVALAAFVLLKENYTQSGKAEKKTIAAAIGTEELTTVDVSYYYTDALNNMYNNIYNSGNDFYAQYYQMQGLDMTGDLTKQTNTETNDTWANYFLDMALESAQNDYVLAAAAKKDNFTLPEEEVKHIDEELVNLESVAVMSGYGNGESYLKTFYGRGATLETYREYLTRSSLAAAYYNHYYETKLVYTENDLREFEKTKGAETFNSYNYKECYLSYTDFLEGGTKGEDGKMTYTEEENNAARMKMKLAAEKLITAKDEAELKTFIEETKINENSQLALNTFTNELHTSLDKYMADWLSADDRKAGEIGMLANEDISAKDKDGNPLINGYSVVLFESKDDNTAPMDDVRHLLVAFEGGHTDETTGQTVYTEAEKTVTSNDAKKLLKQWQDGAATEESFIALVKEHTDDEGSKETGGLYENIHHDSNYVEAFRNWAVNPNRKKGDCELVETEYGVHLMYYVGESDMNYRDYMIQESLKATDMEAWYKAALEASPIAKKDLSKLNMSPMQAAQ